jgi:hypothetical protein
VAIEIFPLQSPSAGLCVLWDRAPVELWSAGSGLDRVPTRFTAQESQILLVRGHLRLAPEIAIEGPSLVLLEANTPLDLEVLDPSVRALLWSIRPRQPSPPKPSRGPRILAPATLEQPCTLTAATSLVHWMPLVQAPSRRTLAGAPTLLLNLGHAALPLVANGTLHPLPGGMGTVTDEVVTIHLRPGTGPLVAVELIEPAS